MTITDAPGRTTGATPRPPAKPGKVRATLQFLRNVWRGLTSMRTALILLFLLALASLPGALLPQWDNGREKTQAYLDEHTTWGPLLNKLGFFDVFASPWYSAIYLLLFISLIGCVLPRSVDFARQLRAKPVRTPRNLARMPLSTEYRVDTDPEATADRVEQQLRQRHWRVLRSAEPATAGGYTVSAEKGYLREFGNLVFHFSLIGLLGAVATGALFGYSGSRLIGTGESYCSSVASYDTFRAGITVDGTDLTPFCVQLDKLTAQFSPEGMATGFQADVQYQANPQQPGDAWQRTTIEVNEPLRLNGQRLYLMGHGYAPELKVTWPNGQTRDVTSNFISNDASLLSTGAVKIPDPPGVPADQNSTKQLAIAGLFAPTAVVQGGIMTSVFPQATAPGLAVKIYRGDLGVNSGVPQSVYAIDQGQVDAGKLKEIKEVNLMVGQRTTLDDGTTIEFTGYRNWAALQTSYDPGQFWALVFAVLLLGGLMISLIIKRRRVWFRITPIGADNGPDAGAGGAGRSLVSVGGLARTDQAGYGAEFDTVARLAGPAVPDPATEAAASTATSPEHSQQAESAAAPAVPGTERRRRQRAGLGDPAQPERESDE
ncbi:cytochrome c biogenesis protein ResB [Nakamurella aerolata]|uniref:Cytochrome c biogenesis protein ResB n=1 Tax=Nakamurella aerolata TaxID=1656892 RepID=A0A849A971_9ACTN|nr:cytochrome c biogenesis protein ResB [Nakamurella aerolata]NNG35030.1 cytochrome c biogenesis protein ResB [Nakamurella aerolata]